MLFLMLLCAFILIFILLCFALITRKQLSHSMLLGICLASFVISMLFPFRYVLSNSFIKEETAVTALHQKNDASFGTDVTIKYIDSNYNKRELNNPSQGKWAWFNGEYKWSEEWEKQGLHPTDTIFMEVPVGNNRSIAFATGPNCGKTLVACLDVSQEVDLYSEGEGILSVALPDSQRGAIVKEGLLRVIALAGTELLIILAVTLLTVFINKKTNWRNLLKWKYEALVFILSFLNIILMGWYPNIIEYQYQTSYYFMPYESGFNSRGLTGTLTLLLGGPYIRQSELSKFIIIILTLTYLFASILIVKQAKMESDWRMGVFWVLLYLLTPLTFIQIHDDARPDVFVIILFILGVILINKKRFLQLIPVFCVVMILINETSCAFFVAPLLALLLYSFLKERDANYLISLVSGAGFSCVTFLKILRLDKSKLMPLDYYFSHMARHTDVALNISAFSAERKDSEYLLKDFALAMGNQYELHPHYELLITTILYFVLIIPFVILFVILWKAVYRKLMIRYAQGSTSLLLIRFQFWILVLSSCGGLACMLMAYDYIRFTEFIMIAALAIIFTLIRKEELVLQIDDLYLFTPPKKYVPITPFVILIYMKFWGTVDVWPRDTEFLARFAEVLRGFFGV